jgi:anti-sigma regulatory factor (Ser/Thr protein kinase)
VEVTTFTITVADASQVGEARRRVVRLADTLGFDEAACGRLAVLATEVSTNLVRHGGGGRLLVSCVGDGAARGIELLALDRGPGIASVREALRDGYSTAGTPGTGLGAMSRVADGFDLHSAPGVGTAVLMRIWSPPRTVAVAVAALEVGGVSVPAPGEDACGDGWAFEHAAGVTRVLVVDGLGHGPDAARVAREAVAIFRTAAGSPSAIVERLHQGLRPTRGGAVGVAEVDVGRALVRFAGVGNIAGIVVGREGVRHLVSHSGIVGHEVRRIDEFSYPWPASALLVLHSDGVATHWDLARYAGLARCDPVLVAGVLYRDFARGRDDATVVVAREPVA